MKKKLFLWALAILWIVAWSWIMSASAHSGCEGHPAIQAHGLCLGRSLAEISCFAGYFGLWTFLGGVVAKSKGRKPAIGWILGFTLQFLGCIIMMVWKPKGELCPRCKKRIISGNRGLCEECFFGTKAS